MTVYVLHLEPRYRHARHYVGFTPDADADRRVAEHLACGPNGSPLIRAAIEAGSTVTVATTFPGAGRDFEKLIKTRKDVRRWCPCCAGARRTRPPSPDRISRRFRESKPAYDRPAFEARAC